MSDRLSAIHEAGHATVGYLLGHFPEVVSIKAQGNSGGHVAYLQVEAESIARAAVLGRRDIDREVVSNDLVAFAAGPVAQSLTVGGVRSVPFAWSVHGGSHDHSMASRLLAAAKDLAPLRDLDDAVESARDLLEEPRIWAATERVARELMRYEEIGYKELQFAVLGHVDDRKGSWPIRAGSRSLSKAEAWTKIAAKSRRGAATVRAWQLGAAAAKPPVERR